MKDLAVELLEFIDDVVDALGSRKEVEYLGTIVRDGTSADRQIACGRRPGTCTRSSTASRRRPSRASRRRALVRPSPRPSRRSYGRPSICPTPNGPAWVWREYDEEGLRFALLMAQHELRDLAVRLAAMRPAPRRSPAHPRPVHHAYRDLTGALAGVAIRISTAYEGWRMGASRCDRPRTWRRVRIPRCRPVRARAGRPQDPTRRRAVGSVARGTRLPRAEDVGRWRRRVRNAMFEIHRRVLRELGGTSDETLERDATSGRGQTHPIPNAPVRGAHDPAHIQVIRRSSGSVAHRPRRGASCEFFIATSPPSRCCRRTRSARRRGMRLRRPSAIARGARWISAPSRGPSPPRNDVAGFLQPTLLDDRRLIRVHVEDVIGEPDEHRGTRRRAKLCCRFRRSPLTETRPEARGGIAHAALQIRRFIRHDECVGAAADDVEVEHGDEALHSAGYGSHLRGVRLRTKKPSSSPANATNTIEWLSDERDAASARATSMVTAGPEALSFAAWKTEPSGSVPTPSR